MNRQSASTATLSDTGGGAATASFQRISASIYYNDANDEPFTGTVVMRADSLYTAEFVEGVLESGGIDVADLTGANASYPSSASDLSNVAWYLMLAGHTGQALDVYRMSLDKSTRATVPRLPSRTHPSSRR